MLTRTDVRDFTNRFRVPAQQILRDHLISHILTTIPDLGGAGRHGTFFGGTALCRTHLLDWRLSEDIDLLVDDARAWADGLDGLPRALRREFPGLTITWRSEGLTAVGFVTQDDLTVRIQLVPTDDSYERYPTEQAPVQLRYPDVPKEVVLTVPTLLGATAMKLNAWAHRAAPRDLADLYAIARLGALGREAVDLAHQVSAALVPGSFGNRRVPTPEQWNTALAAQMADVPDLEESFDLVRETVVVAAGWDSAAVR